MNVYSAVDNSVLAEQYNLPRCTDMKLVRSARRRLHRQHPLTCLRRQNNTADERTEIENQKIEKLRTPGNCRPC